MSDNPKPTTYTHVRGGQRSMQYYAVRTHWKWTFTEKTRCWTTIMKAEWGDDLDVITLLGIEPKPVERDWRRFDELRELVDLGRNRKVAVELFNILDEAAEREHRLRKTAERRASVEVPEQMAALTTSSQECAEKCAESINVYGVGYALRMSDFDVAVKADLTSKWASSLAADIETSKASGTVHKDNADAATKAIVHEHLEKAAERLIKGDTGDQGYDPIGMATRTMYAPALVVWHKTLTTRLETITRTEEALETIRERKELVRVDRLIAGIGGVSGLQEGS